MVLRFVKRLRAAQALNELAGCGSADELRAVLARHPELLTDEATALVEQTVQERTDKGQAVAAGQVASIGALLESCRRYGPVRGIGLHEQLDALLQVPTWIESWTLIERTPDLLSDAAADVLERMSGWAHDYGDEPTQARLEEHARVLERCRREGLEAVFAPLDAEPQVITLTLLVPAAIAPVIAALGQTEDPDHRVELLRPAVLSADAAEPLVRSALLTALGDAQFELGDDAAADSYEEAAALVPLELSPTAWAAAREKAGLAYLQRGDADPTADGPRAAEHFEAALEVFTAEDFPQQCAVERMNLAHAWLQASRHDDPRVACREDGVGAATRAIAAARGAALLVDAVREPPLWANAHLALAETLQRRITLVRIARIYDALIRNNGTSLREGELPELQASLGLTPTHQEPEDAEPDEPDGFPTYPEIDLDADLATAIAALQAVLRVTDADENPPLWASVQRELGELFASDADRDGPLDADAARTCLEAALTVYDEGQPDERARILRTLASLEPDGDAKLERLCRMGEELLEQGHAEAAAETFRKVTSGAWQRDDHALMARAYAGEALAHERRDEYEQARDAAEYALKAQHELVVESPETARLTLQIGRMELALGNLVRAERRLQDARAQCERLQLDELIDAATEALGAVRIDDPLARLRGTELDRPEFRYGDSEEVKHVVAILFAVQEAPTAEARREILAQGLWRFGTRFLDAARRTAEAYEGWEDLFGEAIDLSLDWITGTRLTDRIDEPERRAHFTRALMGWLEPSQITPSLMRLIATALLELPPDHPERDLRAAYDGLVAAAEQARAAGDTAVQLHVTSLLMTHWFEFPGDIEPQVEAALAAFDRFQPQDDHAELVRVAFLSSALLYRAGHMIRARDEGADLAAPTAAVERLLARVRAEPPQLGTELSANLPAAEGVACEALERWAEAAAAWDRAIEYGDLERKSTQRVAIRSGAMHARAGEHAAVRRALEPALPYLQERYLAAVVERDVQDAGRALAHAIDRLAPAQIAEGAWEQGLRTLDGGKSLRLRHRHALRALPVGRALLDLERSIHALTRGVDVYVSEANPRWGADTMGEQQPATTRLFEAYRAARDEAGAAAVPAPTIAEIAATLQPREVAVVLGVHADGTLAAIIRAGDDGRPSGQLLLNTPTELDWALLMIGEHGDGWLPRLRHADGGRARLAAVIAQADVWLGRPLADALAASSAEHAVIIPHKLLHLVPFGALPALAEIDLSFAPSAAHLARVRAGGRPAPAAGALAVCDPTGDLPVSTVEGESLRRHLAGTGVGVAALLHADATEDRLAGALSDAAVLHFAGHAQSNLGAPLRSALLLHPGDVARDGDPLLTWLERATRWEDDGHGGDYADIPNAGRLHYTRVAEDVVELSMEAGTTTTLWARYRDGELVEPGLAELWSAGDIAVLESLAGCQLVVLSACESGATGVEVSIDEFSGLPASLELAGAQTVIATLWPVSEILAAVFVELLYAAIAEHAGTVDLRRVVRRVQGKLRALEPSAARDLVLELADRAPDPRAAFVLERFASELDPAGPPPFADPWEWAAFYITGRGTLVLERRPDDTG